MHYLAARLVIFIQFFTTVIVNFVSIFELEAWSLVLWLILLNNVDRCSGGTPTTHSFFAALTAHEETAPLEVEKGDQHDWETDTDCDVEGPVREVIFGLLHGHQLVINCEVLTLALVYGRVISWVVAASHDIYFIRAAELVLRALFRYYLMLNLWLIHPKTRVKGAPKLDFTVFWQFRNSYFDLDWFHLWPDVGLFFVIPRNIFKDEHAWAINFTKIEALLFIFDKPHHLAEICLTNIRLSFLILLILFISLSIIVQIFLKLAYDKTTLAASICKWWIELESTIDIAATAVASLDKRVIHFALPLIFFVICIAQKEICVHISRFPSQIQLKRVFLYLIRIPAHQYLSRTFRCAHKELIFFIALIVI